MSGAWTPIFGSFALAQAAEGFLSPTNIFAPVSASARSIFELSRFVLMVAAAIFIVVFGLLVAVWKDALFSGLVLLSITACAMYFGPYGPTGQPDPAIIQTVPRPDFFFLWLYAVLSLLPPSFETPVMLIGPAIAVLVLLALPFVSGEGAKNRRHRPIAVLTVLLAAVAFSALTHQARNAPWSPEMQAWSSDATPEKYLKGRTALERQGALVLQAKQCRNCHSLDGVGGMRGPALDAVAVRLTHDQLIRQVIQGGGNMPAYGKNLNPAETTALVAFLETLHPPGQAPAREASRTVADTNCGPFLIPPSIGNRCHP